MSLDPRDSYAWRQLRDQVVVEEPSCWLQLPGCTGASQTADHVIPVSVRPDLAMERSNHRGACHACNKLRRNLPVEALVIGSAERATTSTSSTTSPAPALGLFDG